ncbi:MAG: hypothetical protein ABEH66_07010, partial [Halobacteriales archaeon]
CCLAGVLVGLPVSVLGAFGAALVAGSSAGVIAGGVALAVVLPVAAVGMAAGVGVTFPRFESVTVTRGRQAVVPSLFGFAIYSIALVLAAGPGTAVQFGAVREALAEAVGLSAAGALGAGIAATVALGGVFAALGYAHAVRTFDSYYLN